MNFLSPSTIAIAAGLTIPPLVALYFLKLKRNVRFVPSTLLWKRAVEDLQVNSPFQRLRKSLLLLLQLLILAIAAVALGKPMFQTARSHEDTMILLVDQSASMGVREESGKTRLELAKEQASRAIENLGDNARAMIIAFADRPTVISSFDNDKVALRRKLNSIEHTHAATNLAEAVSLAEAHAQNLIMGGDRPGTEAGPTSSAPPATLQIFTDGRIQDATQVKLQDLDVASLKVTKIGQRDDNVGITAMAAARNYDLPDVLDVTVSMRNFGRSARTIDVTLYVDGRNADVKTIDLPRCSSIDNPQSPIDNSKPAEVLVAFDQVEFAGGGTVDVVLQVDDPLSADDRAWAIIDPPRKVRVLLVSDGNFLLENVLRTLEIELVTMSPSEYEGAAESAIQDGARSAFEVVIFDRHSTARLPQGNYMFWAGIPQIEGVKLGEPIENEVIFDWDETHPILRHVIVETVDVALWFKLTLPAEAKSIMHGQTSPVLSYITRDASQFLICAFSLIVQDEGGEPMLNTLWASSAHFIVFVQNAVQFLAANLAVKSQKSIEPGQPVTIPTPPREESVTITRPDGASDTVHPGKNQSLSYAATRTVGIYRLSPALPGEEAFAVNLFNSVESDVAPADVLNFGSETVGASSGEVPVNRPAWNYFLLAILGILLLEWLVYNRRVFV